MAESSGSGYKEYIAGMLAGIATIVVGHPFDTVKVKLQKHNTGANGMKYKNALHCTASILKTDGNSKDNPGKVITTLKVLKDSSPADLRKLIVIHLEGDQQAFTFLVLVGDPFGAPVAKEKEATIQASKLPICNNQLPDGGSLACLRPVKLIQWPGRHPFSPLENKMAATTTPNSHTTKKSEDCFFT